MSWPSTYPPVSGTAPLLQYQHLQAIWKACRERAWIGGLSSAVAGWPLHVWVPDHGTITSITSTTLTDSTKGWSTSPKRWVGWSTGSPWDPVDYDVCIGNFNDDPHKIIRVPITDNTATTLTFSDITSWVNSNYIASIASLVAKQFAIVRRDGTFYPFWHQRWPRRPNDHTIYRGTVTSATTSSATVSGAGWTVNQFAGKAFFGFDASGIVQRVSISGNTADTLSWSAQAWTATGLFEIQANTSKVCWPGVTGDPQRAWYRGFMDARSTHLPNDTIGSKSYPARYKTVFLGPSAEETQIQTFDFDGTVDFQDESGDRDRWFCKDMFKTPRGIQVWLEGACSSFVEARRWNPATETYDAMVWDGQKYIETMRTATCFRSAGINSLGTFSETANSVGVATFNIPLPDPAPNYYWTVLKNDGELPINSGRSTANNLSIDGLNPGETYRLVVSLGWDRYIPLMVRGLFESTYFIPDTDFGVAIDPPDEEFPGEWHTEPASTCYLEYNEDGNVIEQIEIESGATVRYVGDRWQDYAVAGFSAEATLGSYYMKGARRNHPASTQATIDNQLTGKIRDGGAGWFRTDSHDYWVDNWYAGGTLITHSGVATSGSTNSLADSTKAGVVFWDGSRGRWVNHCAEIETSPGVWQPRPCVMYNAGALTLTVSPDWSVTASGKNYRIREPKYQLNRFRGRRITITDPSGPTNYSSVIRYHNDRHFFIDPIGATPADGWTFTIHEIKVGSIVTS